MTYTGKVLALLQRAFSCIVDECVTISTKVRKSTCTFFKICSASKSACSRFSYNYKRARAFVKIVQTRAQFNVVLVEIALDLHLRISS